MQYLDLCSPQVFRINEAAVDRLTRTDARSYTQMAYS